ncbi:MAG TPA: tetratricopeptide repeat protein [Anaerolineaceae bacterium]|nr:tetratricopeptide repeat protein [Anaerolineaceae bacterium]
MSTPEESMYEQVQEAISRGEKARARDLLTRLLRMNSNNPEYWLWMSSVVESVKERTFCLKEVLRVDPQNQVARKGLILIGALPVDESLIIPPQLFKRNWEHQILGASSAEKAPGLFSKNVYLIGGGLLLLVVFTVVLLISLRGPDTVVVRPTPRTAQPTVTYQPTPSPVVRSATPTYMGPTPLWMMLESTYTPTPMYVKTEHPRTESFRSGLSAYNLGDWDKVILYMQQVLTPEPAAADAYFYIGEAYRFKGENQKAREAYEKAQEINPEFAPAYYGQALIVMANPDAWQEAEILLQTAVEKDPLYYEAYLQLARLAIQTERPQEVLEYLQQARAGMTWEIPAWYLYRAQANLKLGQNEDALQDALTAYQLDQTMLETYRVLGQAYQVNGDLAASVEVLTVYLRYYPEDTEGVLWLARAYRAGGQNQEAIDLLTQVLKQNRRLYPIYMERGWIYLAMGEAAKARDDFESYIGYEPQSLDAHFGLGRAYLELKLYANAWEQFYLAIPYAKTDAEKAELYYWRSLALEGKGDLEAAINDWYEMLKLPSEVIPDEWEEYARLRLTELKKKVPTPVILKTLTPTATPTPTRPLGAITRTPTPTATRTRTPVKTP